MKDPLIDTLAERFADHAVDVDPGTWSAISGQLAVASGSGLSGLLREKFAGHEAPVDAHVWTNISSQIGQGAAASAGTAAGWWAAGIAATLVAAGSILYSLTGEPASQQVATVPTVQTTTVEQRKEQAPAPREEKVVVMPSPNGASVEAATSTTTQSTPAPSAAKATASGNAGGLKTQPEAGINTEKPLVPAPTPEGERTVNTVLQNIVDNYVTSPVVVATEPKVPPPTEKDMPSQEVHIQHDEPAEEPADDEPALPEAVPAPALAVMIPTAFSPNGDGVNDELVVIVQNYQKAAVRIFSASSNALVFSADNLEARWNGRVMNNGQACEPGMYFYALEVTDKDGRTWSKGEVVRLFPR